MKKKENRGEVKKGLVTSLIGAMVLMGMLATVVQGAIITTDSSGMNDNAGYAEPMYIKASNDEESFFEEFFGWILGDDDDDDSDDDDSDDDDEESFFEEFFGWILGDDDDDNGFFDFFGDSESSVETSQIDANVIEEPLIDENVSKGENPQRREKDEVQMYWEIAEGGYKI